MNAFRAMAVAMAMLLIGTVGCTSAPSRDASRTRTAGTNDPTLMARNFEFEPVTIIGQKTAHTTNVPQARSPLACAR